MREPDKLSLNLFLNFNDRDEEAADLDQLLHYVRLYNSRSFHLRPLKRRGSESSHQVRLRDFGNNAWSVLRNLQDKRNVDDRYDTIMGYMAEAFPAFDDIVLEQTGPSSVYPREPMPSRKATDEFLHLRQHESMAVLSIRPDRDRKGRRGVSSDSVQVTCSNRAVLLQGDSPNWSTFANPVVTTPTANDRERRCAMMLRPACNPGTEKRSQSARLGVQGGAAHVDRSFTLDRRTRAPTH